MQDLLDDPKRNQLFDNIEQVERQKANGVDDRVGLVVFVKFMLHNVQCFYEIMED